MIETYLDYIDQNDQVIVLKIHPVLRANDAGDSSDDRVSVERVVSSKCRPNRKLCPKLEPFYQTGSCATHLLRRSTGMKVWMEHFPRQCLEFNTESLPERGEGRHALDPSAPFLLRIGLGLDT